jgi:AcrR family transcriptional regulator
MRPVLPQEVMDGYRRNRIIEAAWRLVAERGPEVKLSELVKAGGVARKTFYGLFDGKDACLRAAVAAAAEEMLGEVERGADAAGEVRADGWIEGILTWVDENEAAAHTLLVYGAALNAEVRGDLEKRLALVLDPSPSVIQEAVAGGILNLALKALTQGEEVGTAAQEWARISLGVPKAEVCA